MYGEKKKKKMLSNLANGKLPQKCKELIWQPDADF